MTWLLIAYIAVIVLALIGIVVAAWRVTHTDTNHHTTTSEGEPS